MAKEHENSANFLLDIPLSSWSFLLDAAGILAGHFLSNGERRETSSLTDPNEMKDHRPKMSP